MRASAAGDIAAIGITNQRETTVLWDRASGKPIHRAIVWQDRRTAEAVRAARSATAPSRPGHARRPACCSTPTSPAPRWPGCSINVPGARARAERGELAFGTIDSFLLWRLTGGRVHATDVTNASRTLLFDIHAASWDEELLRCLRVPRALLPEVRD